MSSDSSQKKCYFLDFRDGRSEGPVDIDLIGEIIRDQRFPDETLVADEKDGEPGPYVHWREHNDVALCYRRNADPKSLARHRLKLAETELATGLQDLLEKVLSEDVHWVDLLPSVRLVLQSRFEEILAKQLDHWGPADRSFYKAYMGIRGREEFERLIQSRGAK